MRARYILLITFLLVLSIRLYFAFQSSYFTDDTSYFTLRQAENILHEGKPLYYDSLSYGGRNNIFLPLYYYIFAFFGLFIPLTIVAQVLPNIFASLIIFAVYLLVKDITKNERISLLTSVLSAFIPIFFYKTINSISIYTLVIPLMLLLIYLFFNIEQERYAKYFLVFLFLYMLLHASAVIFIISLVVYLILIKLEMFKVKRSEIEVVLFSFFVMIWLYLIVFKKLFFEYGFGLVWQNIPLKYLSNYFYQINIWEAIYLIGIIPLVFGLFAVYYYLFNIKDRKVYLLISLAIVITLLMWLKLIKLPLALVFLSIILVLMFGISYNLFESYLEKTRFRHLKWPVFILICGIFIFSSFIPSISYANKAVNEAIAQDEINALDYFKTTDQDVKIASTVEEGHLITYFGERKNMADPDYFFIRNINEIINDIDMLFTTISGIKASEILDKYSIDYIYFSERAKKEYGITKLNYIDEQCFDTIKKGNIEIYKNKCIVVKGG